jgi:hypothetical protein
MCLYPFYVVRLIDTLPTGTGLNSKWMGICFSRGASLCVTLLRTSVSSSSCEEVPATSLTLSQLQRSVVILNGSESSSVSRSAPSSSLASLSIATLSSNIILYNKLRSRVYIPSLVWTGAVEPVVLEFENMLQSDEMIGASISPQGSYLAVVCVTGVHVLRIVRPAATASSAAILCDTTEAARALPLLFLPLPQQVHQKTLVRAVLWWKGFLVLLVTVVGIEGHMRIQIFQCPHDGHFSSFVNSPNFGVAAAKREAAAISAARSCMDLVADVPLDCEMAAAATICVNELWVISTSGCISGYCIDVRQNIDNITKASSSHSSSASLVSVTTRFSASFAFPALPSGIFGVESTRLRGECTHVIVSLANGLVVSLHVPSMAVTTLLTGVSSVFVLSSPLLKAAGEIICTVTAQTCQLWSIGSEDVSSSSIIASPVSFPWVLDEDWVVYGCAAEQSLLVFSHIEHKMFFTASHISFSYAVAVVNRQTMLSPYPCPQHATTHPLLLICQAWDRSCR